MLKCCSTSNGLTVRGLKDFFMNSIKEMGEDAVRVCLERLGYDAHLFNKDSRVFTLTFHSNEAFEVEVKDALITELDNWAHSATALMEVESNGPQKDFITRPGIYKVFYTFSE